MASYNDLFCLMDIDGNGVVTIDEVCTLCGGLNISKPVITRLFSQADTDRSGAIDKDEFSALCEGIILIANLTEEKLVDSFAEQEMRRVFSYQCSSSSETLTREDMRSLLDRLNMLLNTNVSSDTILKVLREEAKVPKGATTSSDDADADAGGGGHSDPGGPMMMRNPEYGFVQFWKIIRRLYPQRQPWEIARVFLDEERRRKERLTKTRTMFEKLQSSGGDDDLSSPGRRFKSVVSDATRKHHGGGGDDGGTAQQQHERLVVKECERCARFDDLSNELHELKDSKIPKLERKVAETDETIAVHQVEHMRQTTSLQQRLRVSERNEQELRCDKKELLGENATLSARVEELAADSTSTSAGLKEASRQNEQLHDQVSSLQRELEQTRYHLNTHTEDADTAKDAITSLKKRLQERDEEVHRLDQLLSSESQLKDEESTRVGSLLAELKRRREEKESEMAVVERQLDEQTRLLARRQVELAKREAAVKAREDTVAEYDDTMRARWQGTFVQGEKQLEERRHDLDVRELDAIQREAELTVREQAFEANVVRAESCALPERERRMRLLKQIENDLAAREKAIRCAERRYLDELTSPELDKLRQQVGDLTRKNHALTAELADCVKSRDHLKDRIRTVSAAAASPRGAAAAAAAASKVASSITSAMSDNPSFTLANTSITGTIIKPPEPMSLDEYLRSKQQQQQQPNSSDDGGRESSTSPGVKFDL